MTPPEQMTEWRKDFAKAFPARPLSASHLAPTDNDYVFAGYLRRCTEQASEIAELKAQIDELMPLAKFAALLIEDVVWYPEWCAIEAGVINADGKGYAPNIKATITKLLKD